MWMHPDVCPDPISRDEALFMQQRLEREARTPYVKTAAYREYQFWSRALIKEAHERYLEERKKARPSKGYVILNRDGPLRN